MTEKPLYLWTPEGEVKGCVQVLHGMAEHLARYERMARALCARGYAVAGRDHAGHGSACPREKLGAFDGADGWQGLCDSARATHKELVARFPGVPQVLLGHSMGSFLAREYILQHPDGISALVLSGTGWHPKALCAAGALAAKLCAKDKPAKLVDKLAFSGNNKSFAPARTAFDWLSRDEEEVDKYVQDPLCGFLFTGKAYRDFFGGLKKLTDLSRLGAIPKNLPVYLMSGARDPVGAFGAGVREIERQYRAAGLSDVTVKLYEGARHELFNEINRTEATDDLCAWLDGALGGNRA